MNHSLVSAGPMPLPFSASNFMSDCAPNTLPPMPYAPYTPVVHLHGHFYLNTAASAGQQAQQFLLDQQNSGGHQFGYGPAKMFGGNGECKSEYNNGDYGNSCGPGGQLGMEASQNRINGFFGKSESYSQSFPLALSYNAQNAINVAQPFMQHFDTGASGSGYSPNGFPQMARSKRDERQRPKVLKKEQKPRRIVELHPRGPIGPICCRWMVGVDGRGERQLCGRQFTDMAAMVEHLDNEHMGQAQTQCGGVDANGESLPSVHICLWDGCSRAGKEFKAKYKLKNHLRVHTGERPFPCEVCHKTFARSENLKIHARIHTGEKPFPCKHPDCPKVFANSSDRKKHQHVHQQRKPYRCDQQGCEKKYTHPSSLRKHLRQVHKVVMPSGALMAMVERRSGESGRTEDDSGIGTLASVTPPELAAGHVVMAQAHIQQQPEFLNQRFGNTVGHPFQLQFGHDQPCGLHPQQQQQPSLTTTMSLYYPNCK